MVERLKSESFFRWFDSGDVYALGLARKILKVMIATPATQHWLPTRMHKFPKFLPIFASMNLLPNVAVRFSSDSIQGEMIEGEYTSTIHAGTIPRGAMECGAYTRNGKCVDCRACWSKDVAVIAYPGHGVRMIKLQKVA